MQLETIDGLFTVCKVSAVSDIDIHSGFFFIGKTDGEISLVCRTDEAPKRTIGREDGWKAFRIKGTLDFSLVGVLSRIAKVLADSKIGIFVVSTYNTDYVLVKAENYGRALDVLAAEGYEIL